MATSDEKIVLPFLDVKTVKDHSSVLESIKIKKCAPTFHSKNHGTEYEELKFIERFSASNGRQVEIYRKVDRANDRYVEIIKDALTGEIIKDTDELLSEHWGHGTAKK